MEDSSISRRLRPRNSLLGPMLRRRHKPCQEIPADLVREILTWLPVKSLMRFKYVSRGWRSIITDPSFARAYRGGMRGLCAYRPPEYFGNLKPRMCIIRLNLDDGIATELIVDHGGKKLGHTNLVNGLICFYSENYLCLYNIATRETLQLPVSVNESEDSCYYFGFDPVSKLHKLLKIRPVYYDHVFGRFLKCEIFTVGVDASWRTVDSRPPASWRTESFGQLSEIISGCSCIDGALYWLDPSTNRRAPRDRGGRIIAFDLSEEKFQPFIRIPPNFSGISLAKFGPRMALFTQTFSPESDSPKSAISYYTNNAWDPSLEYPHPYTGCKQMHFFPDLVPHGILPNGKVVLYVEPPPLEPLGLYLFDPFPIYDIEITGLKLFDPIEGQFQEIEVTLDSGDIMKWDLFGARSLYYYEENIMPLRCLNSWP